MVEIKVQCACGQHYKFEVEPVHGSMPVRVNCPACGADGTDQANAILEHTLAPPSAGPVPPPIAAPAPAARLRISTPRPAAPAAPPPPPQIQRALAAVATTASPAAKSAREGNFVLGTVGAVAGGFVGMMCWFLLIKLTHYEIGIVAWGVGVVTGVGARLLCRTGGAMLGFVAAACAFFAILGGEYLFVRSEAAKEMNAIIEKAYQERMTYAKDAATAQTDDEIKALLVKHTDEKEQSGAPTAEQIKAFKENELPGLRDFANGKPTKAEFARRMNEIQETFLFKLLLLKESVGLFTVLWLLLGVTSAYKLGAG